MHLSQYKMPDDVNLIAIDSNCKVISEYRDDNDFELWALGHMTYKWIYRKGQGLSIYGKLGRRMRELLQETPFMG